MTYAVSLGQWRLRTKGESNRSTKIIRDSGILMEQRR